MGLISWWKARTSPKPNRPWVRPEFLGVALAAAGLFAILFLTFEPDIGSAPSAPESRTDFVGVGAGLPLNDCAPVCKADELLQVWISNHPDANILSLTPRYDAGHLVGYEIVYQE